MDGAPRTTKIRRLNVMIYNTLNDSVNVQDNSGAAIQSDFEEGILSTSNDPNGSCSSLNGSPASDNGHYDDEFFANLEAMLSEDGLDYLSSGDEEEVCEDSLSEKLAIWASQHKLTRAAINDLLDILQSVGHDDLPKDSRTLLKTPRLVSSIVKCNGDYLYIGIEKGIQRCLKDVNIGTLDPELKLSINIDGLPLLKSSQYQVWLILGMLGQMHPFPIAISISGMLTWL